MSDEVGNQNVGFLTTQLILSLVRIVWWPPFGEELLTRLTYVLMLIFLLVSLVISQFVFEGGSLALVAPVPDHAAIY